MAKYNTSLNNLMRSQPVTAPGSGTTYTALVTDRFIDITATAAFALALPTPSAANAGQMFSIKDVAGNAATFNITITSTTSGNIDGAANYVISSAYGGVTLYSDGTNYWTMSIEAPLPIPWTNVGSATQTLSGNNGYYITAAALTTLTLPASPTAGQVIDIVSTSTNTAFFKVAQPATQQIFLGNQSTTVGTGGSLSSSAVGDTLALLCTTGGSAAVWTGRAGFIGNFLVT